ncbi:MAG: ATP-binding protein [Bryobacterales bacterium]|nr:ATP-binding protein [Bryobacterales bacterium]
MSTPGIPRIVLAVGLPASGKSTWFAQLRVQPLSSDAMRAMLFDSEEDQTNHRVVFATLRWMLRKRLELRRPATYLDATHLTRWERSPYLHLANLVECEVEALWFDEPFEVCLQRNAARERVVPESAMRRMRDRFEPPLLAEGFSRITIVRDGRVVRVVPESLHAQPESQGRQQA